MRLIYSAPLGKTLITAIISGVVSQHVEPPELVLLKVKEMAGDSLDSPAAAYFQIAPYRAATSYIFYSHGIEDKVSTYEQKMQRFIGALEQANSLAREQEILKDNRKSAA